MLCYSFKDLYCYTYEKKRIDPITVEIIGKALTSITEQMGVVLIKSAYSTNIKERKANQFFEKKIPLRNRSVDISLDLRYLRQNYELSVKYDKLEILKRDLVEIRNKFTRIHESTHGHSFPDAVIQIINIRMLASNKVSKPKISKIRLASNTSEIAKHGAQNIWKSNDIKKYDTYRRSKLCAGHVIHSPAIIQEKQATTVINSGWQLKVDLYGNLIITKD